MTRWADQVTQFLQELVDDDAMAGAYANRALDLLEEQPQEDDE